jgi:hypothetical protein
VIPVGLGPARFTNFTPARESQDDLETSRSTAAGMLFNAAISSAALIGNGWVDTAKPGSVFNCWHLFHIDWREQEDLVSSRGDIVL